MKWITACSPISKGGLGLRSAEDHYHALLSKQAIKLFDLQDHTTLWGRLVSSKYGKNLICTNASGIWNKLVLLHGTLKDQATWRIGKGDQVSFWFDCWLLPVPLFKYPWTFHVESMASQVRVSELLLPSGEWNVDDIIPRVPSWIIPILLHLPREDQDTLMLHHKPLVQLSTTELYSQILLLRDQPAVERLVPSLSLGTRRVWWFLWKLINDCLPLKPCLRRFSVVDDSQCGLCLHSLKTIPHLFLYCPRVVLFWNSLMLGWF